MADVENVLTKYFHKPDLQAALALYAAIAAHELSGQPVWPMLVGPPGSMKTCLLSAMDGVDGVRFVDELTPQTFISGQLGDDHKPNRNASLLHRIGTSGLLVFSDFSTVLGGKVEARSAILAQLRRVFDGQLNKEFGTDGAEQDREWRGRLTVVAAVTPEIDRHHSVQQALGERFLMVRLPRVGGLEAGVAAVTQDMERAKQELNGVVRRLLSDCRYSHKPELIGGQIRRLSALGEIAVRARTHVERSSYGARDILSEPDIESNTRLVQQLAQLAKGSALLDGRRQVGEVDMQLAGRVALDSMPPARRKLLEFAIEGLPLKSAGMPPATQQYARQELEVLGLMDGDRLSDMALELLHVTDLLT